MMIESLVSLLFSLVCYFFFFFFFLNDPPPTDISPLPPPAPLPFSLDFYPPRHSANGRTSRRRRGGAPGCTHAHRPPRTSPPLDRKSTRLNSSHSQISYAVFCLKKKKKQNEMLNFIQKDIISTYQQY